MTQAQEKAIARIRRLAEKQFYTEDYEFKKWEIEDLGHSISLVLEYGLKNDEGTLAEIYARDYAHLFIGKKGGITYYCNNKRGQYVSRRFEGYSILQAIVDQRI